MNETKNCPNCGAAVPADAPLGLCPKCVMADTAILPTPKSPGGGPHELPTIDAVRSAFPQLEVLELLGAGGMGAVYKARQPRLDRFVALKILPESLAAQPGFAERFSREARLLARLNHPNIVAVYDFGQAGSLFFLLMEFVDGANLRQAMQAGRFSPAAALALVPQICDALQYAHGEGILHRDIKPENILLDTRGRVKIADFGIAKLVQEKDSPAPLTATGLALGTPQYMAPEQLEKPGEVDQRADIYSLGVVFYELLTGELPLGRFAPPSEKSAVDPRVDPIVLKALEKEKERRYRDAGEVKTRVQQVANLPPVVPGESAGAPPMLAQAPAYRTAKGATASMILALVSLLPLTLLFLAAWFVLLSGPGPGGGLGSPSVLVLLVCLAGGLVAIAGVGLGAWALAQIRRSSGQLAGAVRGMFGTFFWPAMIWILVLSLGLSHALGGPIPNSAGAGWRWLVIIAVPLATAAALLTLAWRWVHCREISEKRIEWFLVPAVCGFLLVLPTIGLGLGAGTVAVRQAHAKPESRVGEVVRNPVVLRSQSQNSRGALMVSFGIEAGHGVLADLILETDEGTLSVSNSAAYLLASPDSDAAHALIWAPATAGADHGVPAAYTTSWGMHNNQPAKTNSFRVVLPADVSTLLENFSSSANLGWIDSSEEQVHWFIQRNGPDPGIGVRLTPFSHELGSNEIADSGYAGFGTNWLAGFRR